MDTSSKLVFLGDGAVGKTCFLITYASDTFPEDYIPTVFDNYNSNILIDGKNVSLGFWDYAAREDSDRIRPLMYPDTDCFVFLFSVVNPDSLENIKSKWVPEIQHHCPGTPYIVIATKIDLRDDVEMIEKLSHKGLKPISYETGQELAKEVGAYAYVESSAKLKIGLKEGVIKAAEAVQNYNSTKYPNVKNQKRNCILL